MAYNVLLVDDSIIIRSVISKVLRLAGIPLRARDRGPRDPLQDPRPRRRGRRIEQPPERRHDILRREECSVGRTGVLVDREPVLETVGRDAPGGRERGHGTPLGVESDEPLAEQRDGRAAHDVHRERRVQGRGIRRPGDPQALGVGSARGSAAADRNRQRDRREGQGRSQYSPVPRSSTNRKT